MVYKTVKYSVAVALICSLAGAEIYTHNGTTDALRNTAFNRPESWNDSSGVSGDVLVANGIPVTDIFNETNDFVTTKGFRAWDNGISNRFPCASLTLGSESTTIGVTWKTYTPGYAVIDNCIWLNAYLAVNNNRTHVLDGSWTIVGASTKHYLRMDVESSHFSFRGDFHGEADVLVSMAGKNNPSKFNYWFLPGDFSDYRGQFKVTAEAYLLLDSETATGDAAAPRADALVLAEGGGLMVTPRIGENLPVTRGIYLESGTNTVFAEGAHDKGLLRMPISGPGCLAKKGSGEVTFSGAYSAGDVFVRAGTLYLAQEATFAAESPRFEVAAGATLVVSNLALAARCTFDVEEGGKLVLGGVIPYDAATNVAQPLDFTPLTTDQWDNLPKPIAIKLSKPMTFPIHETNRLVVAKFSAGLAPDVSQFTNTTEKTYGLPNTWFEIGSDAEDGSSTLVYVSKPVVTRVSTAQLMKFESATTYDATSKTYTDIPIWSDGLGAHAGADYLQTIPGEIKTWTGYDNGTRTFPGDSLYMAAGNFSLKSRGFDVPNLTLDGSIAFGISGPGKAVPVKILGGPITIPAGRSIKWTGSVSGSDGSVFGYELDCEIRGGGSLTLEHAMAGYETSILSTNADFSGMLTISSTAKTLNMRTNGQTIAIADAASLGGPVPSFDYDAVVIGPYSFIRPMTSMTLNQNNRGISISSSYGGFDVPEGVELTVEQVVRNNANNAAALLKDGAGTLKLNRAMRFGYAGTNLIWNANNRLFVREGWLRAADDATNGYHQMCVRFAPGTGIVVAPATVNAYGLYLPGVEALAVTNFYDITATNLKVDVRLDSAEDRLASGLPFTVPVCTVTNTATDLTDVLNVLKPAKGWAGRVVAVPLADEGLIRYDVVYSFGGTLFLLR